MNDIYLGIAIILGGAALLIFAGIRLNARLSKHVALATVVLIMAALAAYVYFLRESALLGRLLPFSNLIVIGNWLPLFGGLLAGVVFNRIPGGRVRRWFYVTLLMLACTYTLIAPLLGSRPLGSDYWTRDRIAIQTSDSSCSAACAATLLNTIGIRTSESEMIDLCLTRNNGTMWYGLYRGLKLKTAGTGYDVELIKGKVDDLKNGTLQGPLILSVRLDLKPGIDERYQKKWGWMPGVAHSVVFFRFLGDGKLAEMGDPSVGRERWGVEAIETLWHGDAMRLVKR
jgi:hypothetical protein